jgi:hypothetical protein
MTVSVHERVFANGCLVIGVRDALGGCSCAGRWRRSPGPGLFGQKDQSTQHRGWLGAACSATAARELTQRSTQAEPVSQLGQPPAPRVADRPRINNDGLKSTGGIHGPRRRATFDGPGHPAQEGDAGLGGVS